MLSDGSEFSNKIIKNISEMWPGKKHVHGKFRHSQSQASVERSTQDISDMLIAWTADNNSQKWPKGVRFIQGKKNHALHSAQKKGPYEAIFVNTSL